MKQGHTKKRKSADNLCSLCRGPFSMTNFGIDSEGWSSEGLCVVEVEHYRGINVKRARFHPECFDKLLVKPFAEVRP